MIEYTTLGNLIAPAKVIRCGKGSFPVLSMTMHDGIVLQSERFKKSLASIDQSDYKVVKRGQLVVGFPIDEGVLYVQKAADEGIMSPAYNVWDIDTKKVDPDFLELCLHSPQSMQYYKDKLRGTTARRRSIPTADLLALKIRLPDMQTQREAVAIMRKAEAVIAARQEQLNSFEQLVKSRFIELFGGADHPTVLFENICVFLRNGASIKQTKGAGGYPITRIETLSNDVFNIDRLGYADITDLEKYQSYVLHNGDVLISHINSVAYLGRAVQYRGQLDTPIIHGMNLLCARISDSYNPTYIEWFFKTPMAKEYISTITKKAVNQASITTSDLKKMQVPNPPKNLQDQFAAFVEQTDKSKLAVQQGLQELEILKKSLMQQYFG